jgi:hypothetical protein
MLKRAALILFAVTACTESADVLDTTEQEMVFDQGILWNKDDLTVCWDPSAYDDPTSPDYGPDIYADERGWVKAIVQSTWGRHSRFEINGWNSCASTPNPDIRIGNTATTASSSVIGRTSGPSTSMVLNLGCFVPAACRDPDPDNDPPETVVNYCNGMLKDGFAPAHPRVCIEAIALHEFGHALGLRHEQAHPDEICPYQEERLDLVDNDGTVHDGEPLGAYDKDSIMDYCEMGRAIHADIAPTLSPGVITGINTLYPSPPLFYSAANLGGTETPLPLGPGTFIVSGNWFSNTRSLHATAAYTVTLCNASGCFTPPAGVTATLPSWLSGQIYSITVKTQAVGYVNAGFQGQSAAYPPGKYMAINGTLKLPNDQMSSLFVPPGQSVRICRHEGSSPSYTGSDCAWFVGSPVTDENPVVKLSASGFDETTSFVEVSSFVQLYDSYGFRNNSKGLYGLGTFKVSSGSNFTNVRSWIVPQDLELTVCTGEGTGSGTGCAVVKSGDVPANLLNQIKLIKVRVPQTQTPPCPGC